MENIYGNLIAAITDWASFMDNESGVEIFLAMKTWVKFYFLLNNYLKSTFTRTAAFISINIIFGKTVPWTASKKSALKLTYMTYTQVSSK